MFVYKKVIFRLSLIKVFYGDSLKKKKKFCFVLFSLVNSINYISIVFLEICKFKHTNI